MGFDTTKMRRTAYDATWDSLAWGFTKEVKPDMRLMMDPITSGTTGKIVLGHRVVGLDGTITVDIQQVDEAAIRKAIPWAGETGAIPLVPTTPNVDTYAYAKLLILHPRDMGNVTTQDVRLVKAVPLQAFNLGRTGESDDVWRLVFSFYPDQAKLIASPSVVDYGTIGVPA